MSNIVDPATDTQDNDWQDDLEWWQEQLHESQEELRHAEASVEDALDEIEECERQIARVRALMAGGDA